VRIFVNVVMERRKAFQREAGGKRQQRHRGENSPGYRRHVGSLRLHAVGK
jgi:hypothetical protein